MGLVQKIKKKLMPMSEYPNWLREQGVQIGEGCEIYKTAEFGSEPYLVTLGDHVRVNDHVFFSTHDGGCWVLRNMADQYGGEFQNADCFGRIVVGNNVHIAHYVVILPGVTIGDNSIIGCGAVVTKDIPPNSVAVGVPARVIESIDEYAEKMRKKFVNTKNLNEEEKKAAIKKLFDIKD